VRATPDSTENRLDWIYFKICLGDAIDRCDGLIVSLVPKLIELPGVERWFFIRYLDEDGFHVRVRLATRPGLLEQLRGSAWKVCHQAVLRLPVIPPSDYFPMVPPTVTPNRNAGGRAIGVYEAVYEPESEKFGGANAMPVAEALFEASSRVACQVLDVESRVLMFRKTIAPCLMNAVMDAFTLTGRGVEFWRDYCYYWLGSRSPAADDFRRRFFAKGEKLRREGIPVVTPLCDLPEEGRNLVEAWGRSLRDAAGAFQRAGDLGEATMETLAFNFTHLMNNRIGLYALEEAYLAALLEDRAVAEVANEAYSRRK